MNSSAVAINLRQWGAMAGCAVLSNHRGCADVEPPHPAAGYCFETAGRVGRVKREMTRHVESHLQSPEPLLLDMRCGGVERG